MAGVGENVRNDAPHFRWSALFKKIEGLKGKPITIVDEIAWEADLELGSIGHWKAQLETYLSSYTKGRAREIVRHAGTAGALDAWRILADKGHSLRPMHQQALRSKAYAPRANVPVKDVEMAIIRWENDIRLFEEACAPEVVSEPNRRMFLENMCPDRLRDHLTAQGPLRFPTEDSLRLEISDWTQKELERGTRHPKAAALETHWPEGAAEEDVAGHDEADDAELAAQLGALIDRYPQLNAVSAEINAIVRSKFGKKGGAKSGGGKGSGDSADPGGGKAGKGKDGKGKDGKGKGKDRKCYECDGTDHLAFECPVRKSRVAAGGPERLPKGKGKQAWYPSAR